MKKFYILAPLWILLISVLAYWEYRQEMNYTEKIIRNEALTHLARDKAFRYWASDHGGVYVPITDELNPSPYLEHIPNRDITSIDGQELTLMNPAWMLRQLMEEYEELYGVKGHITSLNPLREGNAPDQWEISVLKAFETGVQDVGEFSEIDGTLYYRLMTPLVTVDRCLKCHAFQGYKTGDVRGGVSVSVSTEPYFRKTYSIVQRQLAAFLILALFGLIVMFVLFRLMDKQRIQKEKAERDVAKLEDMLLFKDRMAAVDNLSSGMAHEINNPLAGIIQAANVLSSRFDRKIESGESVKAAREHGLDMEQLKDFLHQRGMADMIGIIIEGGHRIADIINSLTAYTASESLEEIPKTPDLYVRKALQLIEEFYVGKSFEAERVEVIVNSDESLPEIEGQRLQQALFNIILNAYQNLLESESREPKIHILLEEKGEKLNISIRDNGTGIPEADKKRVLDPFFTTREVGDGKGLGLSIAYHIITKAYHGEFVIDTDEGNGTEITISLPLSTSL